MLSSVPSSAAKHVLPGQNFCDAFTTRTPEKLLAIEVARKLLASTPNWVHHEAAFLSLWIFAEILMRRHARQIFVPIDRLPTTLMIHHLYAQSAILPEQFERAIALNEIRNRVAHGFFVKPKTLNESLEKLLNLVDEFIAMQK